MRFLRWAVFFLVLMLAASGTRAFQLQKTVPALISPSASVPIPKPSIAIPKALPAQKLKPAQFHTPVSSRFRIPGRNKRRAFHLKQYGKSTGNVSIIQSHRTNVGSNSGSIMLSVNVGKPLLTRSSVTVSNAPAGMKFSRMRWSSLTRNMPAGVSLIAASHGSPECPLLQFTFAVPEHAVAIAPVLKPTSFAPLVDMHLLPSVQTVRGNAERIYTANAILPTLRISAPRTFRSLRMVTVTVPMVSANGASLHSLERFDVGITFRDSTQSQPAISSTHDPAFASLDAHLVSNAWDLPHFAVPLRAAHRTIAQKTVSAKSFENKFGTFSIPNADSITDWIDTNAAYIRLAITRDGLYRVNASDLNVSGFSLASAGWNARNLRCYNHGVEIPLWIDTDANGNILDLEFYGQHLRGFPLPAIQSIYEQSFDYERSGSESEYYNVATDTNVYWLTSSSFASSGDVSPLRYLVESPVSSALSTLQSGTVLLHHERDLVYYTGDPIQDETYTLNMTEFVPGERFVWTILHGTDDANANPSNTHFTDTFYISQLPVDTVGKFDTLAFLFRGTTFTNIGHSVQAIVNGITSFQPNFANFQYDSLVMTIPLSQMKVGANVVTINALTLGDNTDQFYLDYYLANLYEALAPSVDTGITKGQWLFTLSPTARPFHIALTDTSAHLYNLTDKTRIAGGDFIDSSKSFAPRYAAATNASLLKCDNIQAWNTHAPGVGSWEILNSQNQADYIVLTHSSILNEAEKLASMRTANGLRSKVVTTDEVFNAFDYGSNEAEAIRRYLTYAYNNYSGAPVAFVTLFGNASWDPKFNQPGDFEPSLIPTYGNPVSDYYFTIPAQDSSLDSTPLMLIARIPAANATEADAYLTKLTEYENAIPAAWDQHGLFLAGGNPGFEHIGIDDAIRGSFVPLMETPPIDMTDTVIDRTDFSGGVDATHIGDIQNLLNAGQSLMYFAGHGATFTSDIAFPDPSVLQNKGLYPLLMTLTCHTGAFAEPTAVTVNEGYIQQPEAGSVQAYGTTGLGDLDYDNSFTPVWIALMQSFDSTHDTTHATSINQLQLLTGAKIIEIDTAAGGDPATTHNETLQNSMLGDAATGFALRPQPEFAVYSNQVFAYAPSDTTPQIVFVISDSSFTVQALIHNYGYAALRPIVIEITDVTPTGLPIVIYDTLGDLFDSTEVTALFGLNAQSVGLHHITVQIDPFHQFHESDSSDDIASIQIVVNGLSTSPFYPYEGSRDMCDVGPDSVHCIVLTPAGSNPNDQVELELDTAESFASVFLDRKTSVGTSYYVTFGLPMASVPVPTSTVYWWRTRVDRVNGDTTAWQIASFSTGSALRSEFSYTSPDQLSSTIISGLSLNMNGQLYLPQHDTIRLEALSVGLLDSEVGQTSTPYAQVFVNGKSYWVDSQFYAGQPFYSGFIILVWTPDGTQIDSAFQFAMTFNNFFDTTFEDSMATIFNSVIAGIPQGRLTMVLTVGSVDFADVFFPMTKSAMQSLGSLQGMSPMTYEGSYALIGTKGTPSGTAKETFAPAMSDGAKAFDTLIAPGTSGVAQTPYTAVAKNYGSLTWSGNTIVSGEDIRFTVLGARRDGSGVDSVGGFAASTGSSFSLSGIDPRIYDQLAVKMNFTRTTSTAQSPTLSGVAMQYDPAPEFTFAPDSITCLPQIANTGGTVVAEYAPATLTCTPGDTVLVIVARQSQGKVDTPVTHLIPFIAGHRSHPFFDTLQTQNELGNVSLTATVNPNEAQNEQLLFNNTTNGSYSVARDTLSPSGDILFTDSTDGIPQHISEDCGYVSSRSSIQIQMISSNPLRDTSTSSITAYFDNVNTNQVILVGVGNTNGFGVTFKSFSVGPLQAELTLVPSTPFAPGQWLMKAFLRDASGNVDTLNQCFTVSNINGIEEVMNYPNPFKETTDFTFVLKSDAPADLKIVVYTIAGRKIRTLTPTLLHAGFNAVEWDGRDERGNEIANGTYLYRVVINGKDGDNVSQAVSQTAVRAR